MSKLDFEKYQESHPEEFPREAIESDEDMVKDISEDKLRAESEDADWGLTEEEKDYKENK